MSQSNFSLASKVKMLNGISMPLIQLGVYMMSGKEASKATTWALQTGYRAIDSAQMYGNEADVGRAINAFCKASENTIGLTREDVHFTSKLARNSDYATARRSITNSVRKSELGYIDLFLLHSPYGGKKDRLDSWKAIEDAIEAGEVKSGGVSNYGVKHLQELMDSKPRHMPVVNQIEVHPFNTRTDLTKFCQDHGIVVEAYAPLARAVRSEHPTLALLWEKYRCDWAQLLVRWSLQKGYVPLPKSVRKERIASNADVGGFEINAEDMATLDGLDEVLVTDWDPLDAP